MSTLASADRLLMYRQSYWFWFAASGWLALCGCFVSWASLAKFVCSGFASRANVNSILAGSWGGGPCAEGSASCWAPMWQPKLSACWLAIGMGPRRALPVAPRYPSDLRCHGSFCISEIDPPTRPFQGPKRMALKSIVCRDSIEQIYAFFS